MRLSFRARIFLSLVAVVALLLGGCVVAIDLLYASRVEDLLQAQVARGRRLFDRTAEDARANLLRQCRLLVCASRVRACFDEPASHPEAAGNALDELSSRGVQVDLLFLATADGKAISRNVTQPGSDAELPVAQPLDASSPAPELAWVQDVLRGEDPARLEPYLVLDGRLFLVAADGVFQGDEAKGVLVLGREVNDALAARMNHLQTEGDEVAWQVGGRIVAASMTGLLRDQAARASMGRGAVPAMESSRRDLVGTPYQVVLLPAGRPFAPVSVALFVSLRETLEFRSRMRALTALVLVLAIGLSLAVSMRISRRVSSPVQDLVQGTRRVAEGDLAHRIPVRSNDELGELAAAFNRMAEGLASKEELRRLLAETERERHRSLAQMVAGVAHEVNTPLGIVLSASSALDDRLRSEGASVPEELREDFREATRLIQSNLARASKLVQSFKNLSVREAVDQRQEVHLPDLVREVATLFGPRARAAHLEVRVEERLQGSDGKWDGFPGPLTQVLLNLLANVERYAYPSGAGGSVELIVEGGPSDGFTITVADKGRGIPAQDLPRVFEPFFTTGRAQGGSGLGLAIVRNLVTGPLGGQVRIESEAGEGTRVLVTLPRAVPLDASREDR